MFICPWCTIWWKVADPSNCWDICSEHTNNDIDFGHCLFTCVGVSPPPEKIAPEPKGQPRTIPDCREERHKECLAENCPGYRDLSEIANCTSDCWVTSDWKDLPPETGLPELSRTNFGICGAYCFAKGEVCQTIRCPCYYYYDIFQ